MAPLGPRGDDRPSTTRWNNDNQGVFAPHAQGANCLKHRRMSETSSIQHQRGTNIDGEPTSMGNQHQRGTNILGCSTEGCQKPKNVSPSRESKLAEPRPRVVLTHAKAMCDVLCRCHEPMLTESFDVVLSNIRNAKPWSSPHTAF